MQYGELLKEVIKLSVGEMTIKDWGTNVQMQDSELRMLQTGLMLFFLHFIKAGEHRGCIMKVKGKMTETPTRYKSKKKLWIKIFFFKTQ